MGNSGLQGSFVCVCVLMVVVVGAGGMAWEPGQMWRKTLAGCKGREGERAAQDLSSEWRQPVSREPQKAFYKPQAKPSW